MHPENISTDWMRPNSMEKDGYSKTVPIKLTSMDILESGELKKTED